jgi:putative N6-adenine-specific DNA methylase
MLRMLAWRDPIRLQLRRFQASSYVPRISDKSMSAGSYKQLRRDDRSPARVFSGGKRKDAERSVSPKRRDDRSPTQVFSGGVRSASPKRRDDRSPTQVFSGGKRKDAERSAPPKRLDGRSPKIRSPGGRNDPERPFPRVPRKRRDDSSPTRVPERSVPPKRPANSSLPSKGHIINSASESDEPSVSGDDSLHRRRHPFPPHQMDVYLSCHPQLEAFLSQELRLLGIEHVVKGRGVELISPTPQDLLRCCLYLGTASQVLIRCGNGFLARGLAELKRKVQKMPWSEIFQENVVLNTKVTSSKSRLYHTGAIQDRIESAIYEALGQEKGDDVARNGAVVNLHAHVFRDRLQLSIESSGSPLHQRQYRLETGKAPLREDLAYAFLWSGGLRPSHLEPSQKFQAILDVFCGSGTVAIEAASMVNGLPPGRLREAPFRGTYLHDPKEWDRMRVSAMHKSHKPTDIASVSASDRDSGVIVGAAHSNATRAGVVDAMEFLNCAFSSHPWLESPSQAPQRLLIASNLPFGRRTTTKKNEESSQVHHLLPMYQKLAHHLNQLSDSGCQYTAIFLTDDPSLLQRSGIRDKVSIAFKTDHGGIPVTTMVVSNT